jgi:hypothetical protein
LLLVAPAGVVAAGLVEIASGTAPVAAAGVGVADGVVDAAAVPRPGDRIAATDVVDGLVDDRVGDGDSPNRCCRDHGTCCAIRPTRVSNAIDRATAVISNGKMSRRTTEKPERQFARHRRPVAELRDAVNRTL